MRYTYQYNVLEHNGRLGTETEQIDSTGWLDYLRARSERYGNLHEFVTAALAALPGEDPLVVAAIAAQIDELFSTQEPTAVFQFTLYCWDSFNAGQLPASAWGAALATAWQCGERAMLDHVTLSEALVIRMFRAADREALFRVGASRADWDAYWAGLPEQIAIYRGVTTAMKHRETGLSWTTNPEQAKQFSGRNVRSLNDIPGVLHAVVPKSAILAVFDQGDEVVIDPAAPKEGLQSNYLSGTALLKFRQNWKKWKAAEADREKRR